MSAAIQPSSKKLQRGWDRGTARCRRFVAVMAESAGEHRPTRVALSGTCVACTVVGAVLTVSALTAVLTGSAVGRSAALHLDASDRGLRERLREMMGGGDADLEKKAAHSQAMCGNCYKMNRCSEIAPFNYSDAKQACLCAGKGPHAKRPCQIQCAKQGPAPIRDTKLMACQKSGCNKCSRNCGGGEYWSNTGTIANWKYSSTYTTGNTWARVRTRARASRGGWAGGAAAGWAMFSTCACGIGASPPPDHSPAMATTAGALHTRRCRATASA